MTAATPGPGDCRRTHLLSLIDSVRGKVVAGGLLDESEVGGHRDALLRHLNDPATVVIDELFVQSWGRKAA